MAVTHPFLLGWSDDPPRKTSIFDRQALLDDELFIHIYEMCRGDTSRVATALNVCNLDVVNRASILRGRGIPLIKQTKKWGDNDRLAAFCLAIRRGISNTRRIVPRAEENWRRERQLTLWDWKNPPAHFVGDEEPTPSAD